ncbi:hypothetical protein, partial [Enterobacter hormaechei]|uniref:hypothetical protein n=1 Tax=Enterobacter hormaechei TaxID=158836 RepID=UPI002DB8F5EE
DGHRTVYGIYDCFLLKSRMHALRNIGSNFNDSDNTAAPVRNGVGCVSGARREKVATDMTKKHQKRSRWILH